jgi:signal transduction histidine kinase
MDVESLREREKELRCLYRIQQFTLNPSSPLEDVLHQVVDSLGSGWQRPDSTGACIEYFGRLYRGSKYEPSSPQIRESLRLGGREIGHVSISDSCSDFDSDSVDVFLDEERQLLKSVSDLISNFLEWRHLEVLGQRLSTTGHAHWQWREKVVTAMINCFDGNRFGDTEFYLGGSTERGQASHGSDIDIYLYHLGTQEQRELLKLWLEGWSISIAEMARIQTGEIFPDGILNIQWMNKRPDTKRFPQVRKVGEATAKLGDFQSAPKPEQRTDDVEAMLQRTLLGLSHELRNPLTAIATNLDLLSLELPSKLKAQTVSEAQQALSGISVLITDLMLFLRAETGLEKPPLEETEVESFVMGVVSRLRIKNEKAQIVFLGTEQPGLDLRTRLNRRITERILKNLVTNSIRYSQSDRVLVSVFPHQDDEVVISVRDEGCGIDEIHHDKLFEQFYRLEASRNKLSGGVGLGLPLAQALAKSQNSTLQLISRPGEGTDVRVIFERIDSLSTAEEP